MTQRAEGPLRGILFAEGSHEIALRFAQHASGPDWFLHALEV
jgi:hypothetical protein